jgi:pimeloyl-ACP methyl ester carboxylesterase
VAVAGSELHYERRGSGPPLLLIQGMGAHSAHWGEPFLRALEKDFDLILYDHRGAGRSTPPEGEMSLRGLADDALGLLDALGIDDAHVLGVSMGGMIAQDVALASPQRLRTLILGCTSCGGTQSRSTSAEVVQRLTAAVLSGDRDRIVRAGFEVVVSRGYASQAGHHDAFAAAAKVFPPTVSLLLAQKAAVDAHDAFAALRRVAIPTLVIHGTADELLAPSNGELVASLIPGARLELLEGTGHLFFWEQPQRSAELIRDFALGPRVLSAS